MHSLRTLGCRPSVIDSELVKLCAEEGIEVLVVPGASAVAPLLQFQA